MITTTHTYTQIKRKKIQIRLQIAKKITEAIFTNEREKL